MSVWESNSVEKNFDELTKDMEKVKEWTLEKMKKIEEMTNIKKKQHLKSTYLGSTQVSTKEDSSWYSKNKYIMLSVPDGFYKNLKDKSVVEKFAKNDSWSGIVFKLTISEDNAVKFNDFKEILDVIYESDLPTHNENLQIVADNRKLEKAIFDLLDQAGIMTKYYGYKTNRSTKKTELFYNFPSEIRGQIATHYSQTTLDDRKKTLLESMNKYWNTEISKLKEERLKKEKEQREKETNRTLALLLAKYDLELSNDWDDILDAILEKNKYLRLAHYLEKNRGDWNEGCHYAELGLREFSVETELDSKINEDIQSYIENWDMHMDGRVFRDCEYNYSVLFGIAEEQDSKLYSDYVTVKENTDEY